MVKEWNELAAYFYQTEPWTKTGCRRIKRSKNCMVWRSILDDQCESHQRVLVADLEAFGVVVPAKKLTTYGKFH